MNIQMLFGLVVFVIVMNTVSFTLMAYDKQCAMNKTQRVSEKTLFLFTGLFGGIGGVLGMHFYNHKKNHGNFNSFFPAMMILQIVILFFAFCRLL